MSFPKAAGADGTAADFPCGSAPGSGCPFVGQGARKSNTAVASASGWKRAIKSPERRPSISIRELKRCARKNSNAKGRVDRVDRVRQIIVTDWDDGQDRSPVATSARFCVAIG